MRNCTQSWLKRKGEMSEMSEKKNLLPEEEEEKE